MPIALTLFARSLRLLGVLEGGETPDATMAEDARLVCNSLLDNWNTQGLLAYAIVRQVYTHVAGTASYALGPGATWDTGAGVPRPPTLESALFQDATQTPDLELPYHLFTDQEYQTVILKGLQSQWPLGLYYSPTVPNGTVTLWPVPSQNGTTVLYAWLPVSAIASVQTNLTLATGYQAAIEYNLAQWLAPEYGVEVSPLLFDLARQTQAAIMSRNLRVPRLRTDYPQGRGAGGFDDYSAVIGGDA